VNVYFEIELFHLNVRTQMENVIYKPYNLTNCCADGDKTVASLGVSDCIDASKFDGKLGGRGIPGSAGVSELILTVNLGVWKYKNFCD